MHKYQYIYIYINEPQSTETCETDRNSDTGMQHRQENFFLRGGGGVYVWASKPLRHDQLARPQTGVIFGGITPKDKILSETPMQNDTKI